MRSVLTVRQLWPVMIMSKSYRELIAIPDFYDRFLYLKLDGRVGETTFGSKRYLNQLLYRLPQWRSIRNKAIIRDNGCDLAHPDFEINNQPAYVHHIDPITIDDILENRKKVLDLNNLITVSFQTHQAIHYGDAGQLPTLPVTRSINDTCPWK